MHRLLFAVPIVLALAGCASATPAPAPSTVPPPRSSIVTIVDSGPVVRALLTAPDAARLGFTTDPGARAAGGPGYQLVGSCKDDLPSDARIAQAQVKDWYTGNPLSAAVSLHQQTAQYTSPSGAQVVAELKAAGGCTAGTGTAKSTGEARLPAAPGVDASTAICTEYTGVFAERNCILVLAHGDLVTEATLDVSGNAAAEVRRRADATFGELAPLLAAALTRI
jgi:hypothetical protein